MEITINGVTLSGETKQIIDAALKLGWEIPDDFKGDGEYYFSESKKELIEINKMNKKYIINAFLKIYREWVQNLSKVKDLKELLEMIKNGPTDPVCVGLLSELMKRVESEKKNG